MKLLDQDETTQTISLAFEEKPEVTLQLLRFMNSGSLNLNAKIRSIAHAITLLGKPPLKQWLLLMSFSKSGNAQIQASPLLDLARSRAKLMAELMKKISDDPLRSHEAALVGILSLIDVMTQTSIEVVLTELDMDDTIVNALTKKEGTLGILLELVIAIQEGDLYKTNFLLESLNISQSALRESLIASFR